MNARQLEAFRAVVEDGTVMWASSNRRDEQLGVILVRSGIVAERALAEALEARAETGVPLGKVLLMSGVITEPALVEILSSAVVEGQRTGDFRTDVEPVGFVMSVAGTTAFLGLRTALLNPSVAPPLEAGRLAIELRSWVSRVLFAD